MPFWYKMRKTAVLNKNPLLSFVLLQSSIFNLRKFELKLNDHVRIFKDPISSLLHT